jgi:acetylornithine/succinyldiaminopimelate/putrescine aminotransferase
MTECPDRGNEVSAAAPARPKYGRPMAAQPRQPQTVIVRRRPGRKKETGYLTCVALALAIFIAVGAAAEEPAIEVTPQQLRQDYKANEVAADERYKGRTLLITGTVAEIVKDFLGYPVVRLHIPLSYERIQANFPKTATGLAQLSKGQTVTLRCRGLGLMLSVLIVDRCSLAY